MQGNAGPDTAGRNGGVSCPGQHDKSFHINIPGTGPAGVNPMQVIFQTSKERLNHCFDDAKEMEANSKPLAEIVTTVLDRAAADSDSAALTLLGALASQSAELWPALDRWLDKHQSVIYSACTICRTKPSYYSHTTLLTDCFSSVCLSSLPQAARRQAGHGYRPG
jgi:hypothetical protein